MAESRREPRLSSAFPLVSLRGAEGDAAISKVRGGEESSAWPGQKKPYRISSPLKGED